MAFLILVALIIVPVAISDWRRGIQPFDRLGKHIDQSNRGHG